MQTRHGRSIGSKTECMVQQRKVSFSYISDPVHMAPIIVYMSISLNSLYACVHRRQLCTGTNLELPPFHSFSVVYNLPRPQTNFHSAASLFNIHHHHSELLSPLSLLSLPYSHSKSSPLTRSLKMSGSGFFGPRRAPPPPPPRCTVFFYSWRCGHRQWVHCSGCDVAGGPSCKHSPPLEISVTHLLTQAHLGHPHVERQLPSPRHRCPTCQWPTEREMELAPLMGESLSVLARQNIAIIRRDNNNPDIIRHRIASDVEATMNPWRREPSVTDDMTTDQLRAHVAQRLERERQALVDDRVFWQRFSQGLEPIPRAAANRPQQLPPTPVPPPQPPVNGWHNPPGEYISLMISCSL